MFSGSGLTLIVHAECPGMQFLGFGLTSDRCLLEGIILARQYCSSSDSGSTFILRYWSVSSADKVVSLHMEMLAAVSVSESLSEYCTSSDPVDFR